MLLSEGVFLILLLYNYNCQGFLILSLLLSKILEHTMTLNFCYLFFKDKLEFEWGTEKRKELGQQSSLN